MRQLTVDGSGAELPEQIALLHIGSGVPAEVEVCLAALAPALTPRSVVAMAQPVDEAAQAEIEALCNRLV